MIESCDVADVVVESKVVNRESYYYYFINCTKRNGSFPFDSAVSPTTDMPRLGFGLITASNDVPIG